VQQEIKKKKNGRVRLTSKAQSNVAAPLTKTLIVLQGTLKAETSFNVVFRKDIFKVVK